MERALQGLSAAPGNAVGSARVLIVAAAVDREPIPHSRRQGESAAARQALDRASAEIEAIAARLRDSGQDEEAEIVETGTLIAQDPSLHREVLAAVFEEGLPAAAAILDVSEAQAELVAALDDARLAERADDIRSVGRRAAGLVGAGSDQQPNGAVNGSGEILVASDLGPAEVAELEAAIAWDRPRGRGRLGPCGDRGPVAGHPDGRRSRERSAHGRSRGRGGGGWKQRNRVSLAGRRQDRGCQARAQPAGRQTRTGHRQSRASFRHPRRPPGPRLGEISREARSSAPR